MHNIHFNKIILLLLFIISFSCKTRLEKQGWQRTAIVSQVDSSIIKKEKELVVQKMYIDKSSYYYVFYISEKDSTGKIICRERAGGFFLNSDIAYYKLESDSLCFVKLLNEGNIQASIKVGFGRWSSLEVLDEPKKSLLEKQGLRGTVIVSRADTSAIKKDKELVVERMQLKSSYYYLLTFVEKDPTGKLINKPSFGFENSFKSDIAYYKWESDSSCLIRLMSHGNVQASYKYLEYSDSSSSFGILDDLK
jgi:hypothetical protein